MNKDLIYWNHPRKLKIKEEAKGWGKECHIYNILSAPEIKEAGYCLKLLVFEKAVESSLHSHALKHEVFFIQSGKFKMQYIDPRDASLLEMNLIPGEAVVIPQNNLHRIICIEPGTIIEASTPDRPEDSFRALPGASQRY